MDLIALVLVLALIGFVVWMITSKVPMPEGWAAIINVFVLIILVLFLLTRVASIPNLLR